MRRSTFDIRTYMTEHKRWMIAGVMVKTMMFILFCILSYHDPVLAAKSSSSGSSSITSAFDSIYQIIAAIVSSIGQLYLLWGVFEWGTALNSNDGMMQSSAFKRIASGLVTCLAPQIITAIAIS